MVSGLVCLAVPHQRWRFQHAGQLRQPQPQLVAGYIGLRDAERLAPHAAAIAARITKLERYAPGILLAVDGHLGAIEPHLDDILERLDEIEPHLDFILRHLDVLAPHCGPLLKHLDALLLYCDDGGKYLEPLLPCVPRALS